MRTQDLHERVIVGAVFGSGDTIRPTWFIWQGRRYRISDVHFSWAHRRGSSTFRHFAVSDGSDQFELVLNGESLIWHLEKVGDLE
jgi:hypothetical protein